VTTNDHILASSPPTKYLSMVNDSDGECEHTKKEVSRSEHGESCPMYFELGNCMEEMNKNKVQLMDGVVMKANQGLIAISQVTTIEEVGLMTMKIHMMQRMTGKQPLMHCTYRVPF
jgi:hypothetical protein